MHCSGANGRLAIKVCSTGLAVRSREPYEEQNIVNTDCIRRHSADTTVQVGRTLDLDYTRR